MQSIFASMASKATLAIPPCFVTNLSLSVNFGDIIRDFYQERVLSPSFEDTEYIKSICRIYPDKGICVHKTPSVLASI